jgi:GGDEF domain-containing protein
MSQQGPILVVSSDARPPFVTALDDASIFPVIQTGWADAPRAITQVQPAAVLAAMSGAAEESFAALAEQIAARKPYLPLLAVEPMSALPENAIPFTQSTGTVDRLVVRLRAALRIRALHTAVLRRVGEGAAAHVKMPETDPARDATVLLLGRGAAFPALSVAFGERMGVVGAFSIEAAANHLNTRDIDGIVLGEGFTARVAHAFLTVLAEDARFRNLPIVLTSVDLAPTYDLPNLEIVTGEPVHVAFNALPLIRQHALEAQLTRTLRAVEAGGLLDPQTGLLTTTAFEREFATAVVQTKSNGGGLSVARFAFDLAKPRAQLDGARIISRLMRRMDFGAVHGEGSVLVVFGETDLRSAHAIARRLSSVMRQTSHGNRSARSEPVITVASLSPSDSPASLLAQLYDDTRRAAS